MRIYFIIVSLLFILWGLVCINSKAFQKYIETTNHLKGIKSDVTETTLVSGKIQGVLSIVIGTLFLLLNLQSGIPW
jgi:hypothetical protein